MKLKQLIQELQEIEEEHGNLEVQKTAINKREFIEVEYSNKHDCILL